MAYKLPTHDSLEKKHFALVNSLVAWFNPGVNIKPTSQVMNKLMVACSGMAYVLTFGQP